MLYLVVSIVSILVWVAYILNRKHIINPTTIFIAIWCVTLCMHYLLTSWNSQFVLPVDDITYITVVVVIVLFSLGSIFSKIVFLNKTKATGHNVKSNLGKYNVYIKLFGIMGAIGGLSGIVLFISVFGFHGGDLLSIRALSIGGGVGSHPLGYLRDLLLPMVDFAVIITIVNWNNISKRQKFFGLWLPLLTVAGYTAISASRIIFVSLLLVSFLAWFLRPHILGGIDKYKYGFKKRITAVTLSLFVFVFVAGLFGALRMAGTVDDIVDMGYTEDNIGQVFESYGDFGAITAAAISSPAIYIAKPITELDIFLEYMPDTVFWGGYEVSVLNIPLKLLGFNAFDEARKIMFFIQYRAGRWENTWATSIRDIIMDFGYYGMFVVFFIAGGVFQYTWSMAINSQRMDWYILLVLQLYFVVTSTWYSALLVRRYEFALIYILLVIFLFKGKIKFFRFRISDGNY